MAEYEQLKDRIKNLTEYVNTSNPDEERGYKTALKHVLKEVEELETNYLIKKNKEGKYYVSIGSDEFLVEDFRGNLCFELDAITFICSSQKLYFNTIEEAEKKLNEYKGQVEPDETVKVIKA